MGCDVAGDDKEIRLVRDAFAVEAKKWDELAAEIASVRSLGATLELEPLAFFCGNPLTAKLLGEVYEGIFRLIITLMADAETEFHELGRALLVARDLYDGTDRTSASAFIKIYGSRQ